MSDIDQLITSLARYRNDPLGFVHFAFPWRQPGTPLADEDGPDAWQIEVLSEIGDLCRAGKDQEIAQRIAVKSGHGCGKLLSNDSLIPTPSGMRRHGDLEPGDMVIGASGKPTRVIATHHYTDVPMFRVTFDDRTFADVSEGHMWTVRGRHERRNGLDSWRTLETLDIIERGVKRRNGTAMARQWEIPIQGPAEFAEREIDLHPYVVGIWIGDGSKGEPAYTKPYPEIADAIRALGYEVNRGADGKAHRLQGVAHLFRSGVFECGSHERYIPDNYKFNTVANRTALLRGLCDSDGEVNHAGTIGYSTTSRRLADDVAWLARSLGCKVTLQPTIKNGWYPGENGDRVECRDCYRLTINAPFNPFTLEHRKIQYKPSETRYLTRWIESIEPLPNEPTGRCITVESPDGLYQANDFIVTHNTACIAWIIIWFLTTRPFCQIVVTANTQAQLSGKTWREVAKWKQIAIHGFGLNWTATKLAMRGHEETWFASAVPWSKENAQAFAGTHEKHVLILFDEASTIADVIWDTAEGAMTTPGAWWIAFGNPTENVGRFRECFPGGRFAKRWHSHTVDTRTAKKANRAQIDAWIEDYGIDDDFVRIRVLGEFPKQSSRAIVSADLVDLGMKRPMPGDNFTMQFPRILSVDVARFGECQTVFCRRQGTVVFPLRKFRGLDTQQVAGFVAEEINAWDPNAVFIDAGGLGAGVYDRLKTLGFNVIEVLGQGRALAHTEYSNKRAECWFRMAADLKRDSYVLPFDEQLKAHMVGPMYTYDAQNRKRVERKEDMMARSLESPDCADALSLSYCDPVSFEMKAKAEASLPSWGRAIYGVSRDETTWMAS